MKIVISLLVMTFFCLNSVTTQAGNVVVNVRKNVVNHQDGNSSINSGIDLGNSKINHLMGNGIKGTRTVKLSKFVNIAVTGAFKINIICNCTENSMKITGDTNLIELVTADIEKEQLKLQIAKSYTTQNPIKIEFNIDTLNFLKSGGANIIIIDKLNTENFNLTASGASKITLSGKVMALHINAQGAADIEAGNLLCQQINIDANGATRIFVTARQKLKINAENAAKIYYTGKPREIIKNISGAAQITPL